MEDFMSFIKISHKGAFALSVLSLLFVISCEKDDSKKDNPEKTAAVEDSSTEKTEVVEEDSAYAETVADYTWEGEFGEGDEKLWNFEIKFIAEEGEGQTADGESFKNLPIKSHYGIFFEDIKQKKGYKPGIKPLKHQKIRIRYEKEEPIMFYSLENLKYQDEQGNVIELK